MVLVSGKKILGDDINKFFEKKKLVGKNWLTDHMMITILNRFDHRNVIEC